MAMIIHPFFLWALLILICIVTAQFIYAKEWTNSIIWFGAAITEAGWLYLIMYPK